MFQSIKSKVGGSSSSGGGGGTSGTDPSQGMMSSPDRAAMLPQQQQQQSLPVVSVPSPSASSSSGVPRNAPQPILQPPRPVPVHQFQVTKLRSWRTGYVRLLVLHERDFLTLDPTSTAPASQQQSQSQQQQQLSGATIPTGSDLKETNRWPYSSLTEYLAVPKEPDTILLQVGPTSADTLKLCCHGVDRSTVLTRLLQQQHVSGQAGQTQRRPLFPARRAKQPQSISSSNASSGHQDVLLHILPFGLLELHGTTRQVLQTYLFRDLYAVSFPAPQPPEPSGIFLHFYQPNKILWYTVLDNNTGGVGSGRTALLKACQEACIKLGLDPLPMEPSFTVDTWRRKRRSFDFGPVAVAWTVTKTSRRHDASVTGNSIGDTPGGVVTRQLAVTGGGFLVERNVATGVVASARRVRDVRAVVRAEQTNDMTLEWTDGSSRTYGAVSHPRDAMIVSLLDVAMQLQTPTSSGGGGGGGGSSLFVTNVPSAGYRIEYHANSAITANPANASKVKAAASAMFQPTPVPLYTLKRVYTLATHAWALVSGEFGSAEQSVAHQRERAAFCRTMHTSSSDCIALHYACREFNASVGPHELATVLGSASTPAASSVEKHIVGATGALWGMIQTLLCEDKNNIGDGNGGLGMNHEIPAGRPQDTRVRHAKEQMVGTFFQTLYRLAKTPTGYKSSAELTTLRDCLPELWSIQDVFCKYGAYAVINTLLSGTNRNGGGGKRDMEAEYVNKNVLLKCGGPRMVDGLVSSLLPGGGQGEFIPQTLQNQVSDLISMVTSDILQSLLCSYYDTTSPEHFQAFIGALAVRYRALLSVLRSSTPFVLENTALLLHLLSTHAPESTAAIRDAALSSAILLQHFYAAIFSPLEGQRFLSRYLCSLWLSGPMRCDEKRLLKRIVPHGFLAYLNMPVLSRMEEEQLDQLERDAVEGNITDPGATGAHTSESPRDTISTAGSTNTSRLRSRIAIATTAAVNNADRAAVTSENFRIFFHVLTQDHSLADLIWSQQTRRELRIALESELEYIRRETDSRGVDAIAWNHQQFRVEYPSLDSEVKVGDVYMRLWLEAGDGFIRSWEEPVRLFEHLFRRFLCEIERDAKVTVMCIRCLERLYAIHASAIGPFTDVMILVRSMVSTRSVEIQHRLLKLLATVLGVTGNNEDGRYSVTDVPENAEQLLNVNSISQLCQFVAWGHTNGDQVANLLTRLISSGANDKALLTDGSNERPNRSQHTTTKSLGDSSCPAVWFLASTGRIPPHPESIRGPFRVSDLVQMMEDGDISPYELVTASHVDEYDLEDTTASTQEAQVDTGKWKRLNQVWQLRWQLCTDGTSTSIYSPSEVALVALKALTRLVDLHRSLDSRGVPYFPIPTAKRILCGSNRDPVGTSESDDSTTNPLPIITQAILCNDNRIVDQAAELMCKLCTHNERAVSKLYLSGIFYFVFCYTGSNFKRLASFLNLTHLKQNFRSGFAAAANSTELPMKERSILGHMLPEGLLFILTNYGVDRFADVFVSSADTPEVIWTFEMRKHLIEMIRQHLGDFPLRLFQNTTTEYEFCPIPGVAYKKLEQELFCHNYYLHNLCDEVRFPEWPISEPVEVFRACLERFKNQQDRDGCAEEQGLESARTVLGLEVGDGSKELRKSYRSLARKFHPDKNPSGREKFESIQRSYEALLPLVERGEKIRIFSDVFNADDQLNSGGIFPAGKVQLDTIHLLIKTQLLICRRYEADMLHLKYPLYPILLQCIELPSWNTTDRKRIIDSPFAASERAEFVQSASELIFRTCLISPQNAEELIAESGVAILSSLMAFYVELLRILKGQPQDGDPQPEKNQASMEIITAILSYTLHTLSGIAFFGNGRAALNELPDRKQFFVNWRRCLDGSLLPSRDDLTKDSLMKTYAIEGIENLAADPTLQKDLIGSGVVWPLLKFSNMFDPTLEESVDSSDQDDLSGMSISSVNMIARRSVRALGVLSGLYGKGPENTDMRRSLELLLTSPIARMLRNKRTGTILAVLNTNVERADIVWNTRMRDQLESLLEKLEKERPEAECRTVEEELRPIGDFQYEALLGEVRIGGVYVRFFNNSGKDALVHVENPLAFLDTLLNFVGTCLNEFDAFKECKAIPIPSDLSACESNVVSSYSVHSEDFLLALKSLQILCRIDGIMDEALCQTQTILPTVFLSFLELPADSETFDTGSDLLSVVSSKQNFANAVVKENAFWRLLELVERATLNEEKAESAASSSKEKEDIAKAARGWFVLEALSSSPAIANCILSTSGWLELLGVTVGYSKFTKVWSARVGAAKTLSRLLWDPSLCSTAESLLLRFLPRTLALQMKEDPESMLRNFDSASDSPELIWDSSMRGELRQVLTRELDILLENRKENPGASSQFSLAPAVCVQYSRLADELYIGGVYVSRFLKEPTYNLRDPTAFLELLLQRWAKELEVYTGDPVVTNISESTAISGAGQDILELVTTASVYVCKVRDSLCDKLALWGYMARCITFLDLSLARDITGTPLLCILRIMHVASGRILNAEALALQGHNDGRAGVVDLSMKAIGVGSLHTDSGFIIEFLKILFEVSLGDLTIPPAYSHAAPHQQHQHSFPKQSQQYSAVAMAPSPAPGEGPVRKRVNIGDDPLGMFQAGNPAASQSQSSITSPVAQHSSANETFISNQSFTGSRAPSSRMQSQSNVETNNLCQQEPHHLSFSGQSKVANYGQLGGSGQSQQRPLVGSHLQQASQVANYGQPVVYGQSQQRPSVGSHLQQTSQFAKYGQPVISGQTQHHPSVGSNPQQAYATQAGSNALMQNGNSIPGQQYIRANQGAPTQNSSNPLLHHSQTNTNYASARSAPQSISGNKYQHPSNTLPSTAYTPTYSTRTEPSQHTTFTTQHGTLNTQTMQANRNQINSTHNHGGATQQRHTGTLSFPQSQQQPSQIPMHDPHRAQNQIHNLREPHVGQFPNQHLYQSSQQGQLHQGQQHVSTQQYYGQGNHMHPAQEPKSNHSQQQGSIQQHFDQGHRVHPVQQSQSNQFQESQTNSTIYLGGDANVIQNQAEQGQGNANINEQHPQTMGPQGFNSSQYEIASGPDMIPGTGSLQNVPASGQHGATLLEGSGVDARTSIDPAVSADQRAATCAGAIGAAQGRVALLQQALACNLCAFLVNDVLENKSLQKIRDPTAAKVHAIGLLTLLTKDPGFGPKFKLILEELPQWKKYGSQDHSLLITGHKQKADYFLTDGHATTDQKLLTEE